MADNGNPESLIVNYRLDAMESTIKSMNDCLGKLTDVVVELAVQKKQLQMLQQDVQEIKKSSHRWSDRILDLLLASSVAGLISWFFAKIKG